MQRLRLIRFRLTLFYTLLLTVAFTVFSVGLFVGIGHVLNSNFDSRLSAAADKVIKTAKVSAIPVTPYQWTLKVDSETIGGDLNSATTKFTFVNARGEPLAGDNKQGDPKSSTDPKVQKAIHTALTENSPQSITLTGKDGETRAVTVVPNQDNNLSYVLLVEESRKNVEDTLGLLVRILILAAVAVTMLSGIGAWFLTGRVLRPIDEITEKVRSITARDLSKRLGINQPDELGRLAGTFDDMIGRLQASFERQKRFTSDASHELRTPLTVMQADISLALKRPRSVGEYRTTLESAQEEVERLSRIVSELLTLARLDTDSAQIAHEEVLLDDLLTSVVGRLRPLASEKGIALTYLVATPITISGDAARLKQLFLNLIDNAIAYTPSGGNVRVTLDASAEMAEVSVHDTGIGIDPKHVPHIFERFYRTDEARSRHHEGTGLGLAIAQSAAQAHHGQIEVVSSLGEGTTFKVSLPRGEETVLQTSGSGTPGRLSLHPLPSGMSGH